MRLDDGSAVHVESEANVLVPWPGQPLTSGERREVRVRMWTDLGCGDLVPAPVRRGSRAAGAPTWRRFRVQPRPGGGITWADVEHVTPHGPARVSWRLDDGLDGRVDGLDVEITVPPGCVAEVVLPEGTTTELGPGTGQRLRV